MAFDRFLIGPLSVGLETDLKPFYDFASLCYDRLFTWRCKMVKTTRRMQEKIIDITGKVFNDLTVVSLAGKGKYRGANWNCICKCGKECVVPGGHLRADMRKSCGCRSLERIEQTAIKNYYGLYKAGAIRRKLEFTISLEEFEQFIIKNCFYCGIEPKQVLKRQKSKKIAFTCNGIDRLDPEKGYFLQNCVTSCFHCNRMKYNLNAKEFFDYIERIYKCHLIDS